MHQDYTHSFSDRLKLKIWKKLTPVFLRTRDALLSWRIIWHKKGRQNFLIGQLAEGCTVNDFKEHLVKSGFEKNLLAWVDEGEVLSYRKLENFHWSYHVRLFYDGEVRGHYEKTTESHPIDHFLEVGMDARTEEFKKMLGVFIKA